jgi:hypothetical protein
VNGEPERLRAEIRSWFELARAGLELYPPSLGRQRLLTLISVFEADLPNSSPESLAALHESACDAARTIMRRLGDGLRADQALIERFRDAFGADAVDTRSKRVRHRSGPRVTLIDTPVSADLAQNSDGLSAVASNDGTITFFVDLTMSAWGSAVREADEGEPHELCRLLVAEPITKEGRVLVRDLVGRYKFNRGDLRYLDSDDWSMADQQRLAAEMIEKGLKRPRGRQRIPLYDRSENENRVSVAVEEYRALRKRSRREPRSEVIERVAELHHVPAQVLEDALQGKRRDFRDRARRRKAL